MTILLSLCYYFSFIYEKTETQIFRIFPKSYGSVEELGSRLGPAEVVRPVVLCLLAHIVVSGYTKYSELFWLGSPESLVLGNQVLFGAL